MKYIKLWFLPLVISTAMFLTMRPVIAQIIEEPFVSLADYLKAGDVEVGIEAVNGFTQVYFVFDGQKKFITEGSVNSNIPVTDGETIVYRKSFAGGDQLFLYNILTDQTIQITSSGHNANPKISGKSIVWEGLSYSDISGRSDWQIFLFDGMKTTQLTSGDLSLNPEIDGDNVTYGRKDITGTWRSVVYSIEREEVRDITTGISSKNPKIKQGKIFLGEEGKEEEFELTVDDLFLLDLAPLTSTISATIESPTDEAKKVTVDDILQELEATVSAIPNENR